MDAKIVLEGNFITFFEEVANKEGFKKNELRPHNRCIRKDTILEYSIYDIEASRNERIIRITTVNDKIFLQYSTYDEGNKAFKDLHKIMTTVKMIVVDSHGNEHRYIPR